MKSALIALTLVGSSARIARADGWWTGCGAQDGGAGCQSSDGAWGNCQCNTASHDARDVGAGLALLGVVGYRLGRKRRTR